MMKVISTNIGEKVTIVHNGKEEQTGIYKYPVEAPVYLGRTGVLKDHVMDTRYHGGVDKACYMYPVENYTYWQSIYPNLNLQWGMFGENLSIEGLSESTVRIGDIYKIGEAEVQVSQPRQPCYKLGIRFNDPKVVKQFSNSEFPGIYVRVLKEGYVRVGDEIELLQAQTDSLSVTEIFELLMKRQRDLSQIEKALSDPFLADSAKKDLHKIV